MTPLLRLSFVDATLILLALAMLFGAARAHEASLGHASFLTGYVMMVSVVFLAALNWRKKLSFIPLGKAGTWLRIHIAVGFFVIGAFAMHAGWSLPSGWFESVLYVVFALTTASGFVGLFISRQYPLRLSKLREEYLYERIPAFRAEVRRQAHDIVLNLVQDTAADTVADFYTQELSAFFVKPRGLIYFLRPTSGLRNELQARLTSLARYCSPKEQETRQQLSRLIDRRDDLDYHSALQGQLKWWLFGHIALTYILLALSSIHVIVAHAFQGVVR